MDQDRQMPTIKQGGDACHPRFFIRAVLDDDKSKDAGHPIFVDAEYVEVIIPKSKSFRPVFRVKDEHRQRWPQQYAAFKQSMESVPDGYRLDEWALMPRSMAETLKGLQIYTIEQFVTIPADDLKILGPGILELQKQGEEILSQRDEKQEQIDALKKQNQDLQIRLERLEVTSSDVEEPEEDETVREKRLRALEKARAAKKAKAKAAAAAGG